jgi:cytochrome c oxidase subunit 1
VFVGFNITFFPQFIVGYLGMPRRYHAYPDEFQVLNVMSSAGATVLGLGYVLPVIYFLYSLVKGSVAGPNPWRASTLEWQTSSPPPTENFLETPIMTHEPYEYEHVAGEETHRA